MGNLKSSDNLCKTSYLGRVQQVAAEVDEFYWERQQVTGQSSHRQKTCVTLKIADFNNFSTCYYNFVIAENCSFIHKLYLVMMVPSNFRQPKKNEDVMIMEEKFGLDIKSPVRKQNFCGLHIVKDDDPAAVGGKFLFVPALITQETHGQNMSSPPAPHWPEDCHLLICLLLCLD